MIPRKRLLSSSLGRIVSGQRVEGFGRLPRERELTYPNVFIIASPLQLLNAIEARHSLALEHGNIVLLTGLGYANETDVYATILNDEQFETVRYVRVKNENVTFRSRCAGEYLSDLTTKYWRIYRRYSNRRGIDRIAKVFRKVDNLFVGNYLEDGELYMRHAANSITYNKLYLVDDGTDILKVNSDRRRKAIKTAANAAANEGEEGLSAYRKLKKSIYRRYIDWDKREADQVTFFTAYKFEARKADAIVENSYSRLRRRWRGAGRSTEVLFLGQSFIEDGWISRDTYFHELRKVRAFFSGRELFYVPHPRESIETVHYVQEGLGFAIKRFDLPIEIAIGAAGAVPETMASFFCSALPNCSAIYGDQVRVVAFQMRSSDFLVLPTFVEEVYAYFRSMAGVNFQVLTL